MKKKKDPVLRRANKASKRTTTAHAEVKPTLYGEELGEDPVHSMRVADVHKQLAKLHAACSPDIYAAVRRYLDAPEPAIGRLLDAWEKCGRHDRQRSPLFNIGDEARRTMTPLGFACLIRYAQAWLDEFEASPKLSGQVAGS